MAASTSPAPKKKSALSSPVTWIIVLGVAVLGGAYLLYRRSQSSSSSSSTGTTTDTTQPETDYGGQIATLQDEIENLQSSGAQSGSGSTAAKPDAPANLKATGTHPTSGQVSWDLPGGVSGITWHVTNHLSSATGTVTDNFTTNNTVANIGGALTPLKADTTYVTVVYGSNSAGDGPSGSVTWKTAASSSSGSSTSSSKVKVPNVVGRTDLSTAKGIITAVGLKAKGTGDSAAGNKGSVTKQSPAAGASVAKGSTVTLTYTVK